jgi:hypothetical protein
MLRPFSPMSAHYSHRNRPYCRNLFGRLHIDRVTTASARLPRERGQPAWATRPRSTLALPAARLRVAFHQSRRSVPILTSTNAAAHLTQH